MQLTLPRPLAVHAYTELRSLKLIQEHRDQPELIVQHLKTDKTDNDDRHPYQQPSRNGHQEDINDDGKYSVKATIQLAMALVEQNDQLVKKIQLARRQLEDQQLKYRIFEEKVQRNNQEIKELKKIKDDIEQKKYTQRMSTLNQSQIPNKSSELSTTFNTNCWANQFLNKEELQSLWTVKKQSKITKSSKFDEKPLKCFTIDLSSCIATNRQRKESLKLKSPNTSSIQGQHNKIAIQKPSDKTKKMIVSVAHNAKNQSNRYDLKLHLNEKCKIADQQCQKTKILSKTISQLRNVKKIKPNPQM